MQGRLLLVVAFLSLWAVFTQAQSFSADITIYSSPGVQGILTGKMYYDFAAKKIRIDYNMQGTGLPREIIYYSTDQQVRYLGCGSPLTCNAESYKLPFPLYHKISEGSNIFPQAWSCGTQAYTRSQTGNKEVNRIAFDAANNPCVAYLNDGTRIVFSSVVSQALSADVFSVASWNCPSKQCNIQLDVVEVLDCSGSVAGEWTTEVSFARSFAQSFTISEQAVKVGLVTFSDTSKTEFNLLNDKNSVVNGINSAKNRGGNTCIGCGLKSATDILKGTLARGGVQKVILLITDGLNNEGSGSTSLSTATANAKALGTWIFVIGVTTAVNADQLKSVASGSNGFMQLNGQSVKTYYTATNWADLAGLLNQIVTATCQDISGNPCSGCNGFCACNQQCICPDTCDTSNKCKTPSCSPTRNGGGCAYDDVICNDNDYCTTDYCDSSLGCRATDVVCPDKPCFTLQCAKSSGCIYTPVECKDDNPCTDNFCNTNTNMCDYTPVTFCSLCNYRGLNASTCQVGKPPCEVWDCVQPDAVTANCEKVRDKSCDDQNKCTTDSCDPATGTCINTPIICNDQNFCTDDTCDAAIGCVYTPINITTRCNDDNVCTNDTCIPATGCVNLDIPCTAGDPCHPAQCHSTLGCQYPTVVCSEQPGIKEKIGTGVCYIAECNDGLSNETDPALALGCNLRQQEGTTIDKCGVCEGDGTSCFLGIGVAAAAGIGAGILAAIIVGVVAGVAIVGTIAGKKGYDAYVKYKREMGGAHNNALYVDNGRTGTNPFYGQEMSTR